MAGPVAATVWDWPLRAFHWALVALVVFSYVTAKVGGAWLEWHMRSGYAILALLLFRIAWGFTGGSTARFAHFIRGPGAALRYVRDWRAGRRTVLGHNPMGGWMVALMLLALLAQAISGLFVDDEIATQGPLYAKASSAVVGRMTWLHSANEWVLVGLVAAHVAAVLTYQWGLRMNLIGPMWHGRATLPTGLVAPRAGSSALAAVLMVAASTFVYWLVAIYPRTPA